ncbi:non-hydrolyzing UDP-N-acetylglucosamine 2-epimerase [Cohnella suwonensis]|uniref:Non-hydrolyzing UDP-N-acetylglucosamine 2-epimerase n=1 Tax=Cohnella suwonensis TaxID=696072 RepID=A0ABW0LV11_9BACL
MRIVTVIGARPQFIKASMLSSHLSTKGIEETLIHTGQHFDRNMSDIFFSELGLQAPQILLDINGDTNTRQTARVMMALEGQLRQNRPSAILVYGDTNATLAGAMVGAQLNIPVIHVEAGLRSYDRRMPEEINRVLTDNLSSLLFCPTQTAVKNLEREGIQEGVHDVGDIMYDAVLHFAGLAKEESTILERLQFEEKKYILATVHRNFNTDDPARLKAILRAFKQCEETIVFPMHPRTKKMIAQFELNDYLQSRNMVLTEPLGYLDMIRLQAGAKVIVTDSGGVQKEAYFNGVPSVILRENTEWVELVELGWGKLVSNDSESIVKAIQSAQAGESKENPYGKGNTGISITDHIHAYLSNL